LFNEYGILVMNIQMDLQEDKQKVSFQDHAGGLGVLISKVFFSPRQKFDIFTYASMPASEASL
jgi:hypothetical protein